MNTKYMKHYQLNGEDFASEHDCETVIWLKDGDEVDITPLFPDLIDPQLFMEAENEAEGYDPADDLYEQSLER